MFVYYYDNDRSLFFFFLFILSGLKVISGVGDESKWDDYFYCMMKIITNNCYIINAINFIPPSISKTYFFFHHQELSSMKYKIGEEYVFETWL